MKYASLVFVALLLGLSFSVATAGAFDGKQPLICTLTEVWECDSAAGCEVLGSDDAHDIRHLAVDFRKRSITLDHIESKLSSRIDKVQTIDGKLILQGIEDGMEGTPDGAGWAMTINNRYGNVVLTVAGDAVAFVGLGGCVAAGS
jgi:hypothetical protein